LVGDTNGDRVPDLIGVTLNNTGSKKTEVHVLNGATNFSTWLTQLPTPLSETNTTQTQVTATDQDHDGITDLAFVSLNGTGSKKTEVHVLSGASNYQTWITHAPTALGESSSSQWRFVGEPTTGYNASIPLPPAPQENPPVVAAVTPGEELYVKSGNLFGEWVKEGGGIKSASVAVDSTGVPLIAALTNNGHALVKSGLYGEWVDEGSGITAVSIATDPVNGPLIGVLTSNGHALVKKGLYGEWVDETGGASAVRRKAISTANGSTRCRASKKSASPLTRATALWSAWSRTQVKRSSRRGISTGNGWNNHLPHLP